MKQCVKIDKGVDVDEPIEYALLNKNCKNAVAKPKNAKGPPCKLFRWLPVPGLNYRARVAIKLERWKLYQERRNMLPYFISPTVRLCSGVKILYLISQVAGLHCGLFS